VTTHGWVRPRLLGGEPVLWVRPAETGGWENVDRRKRHKKAGHDIVGHDMALAN